MKNLLFVIGLILASAPMFGYDFESNGLYYNIVEASSVEVTYGDEVYSGEFSIPERVYNSGKEYEVIAIGEEAFYGCEDLTGIKLPTSLESLRMSAFEDCSNLIEIEIPTSVTYIGSYAFSGCTGLTRIEIPNSVTTLREDIFSGCSNLSKVKISDSVQELESGIFRYCSSLTSIEIPKGVESIRTYAFEECENLKTIFFYSNNLLDIASTAFENCPAIKEIFCYTQQPPVGEDYDVFDSSVYTNATLYVPGQQFSLYKSTIPWDKFSSIKELNDSGVYSPILLNSNEYTSVYSLTGISLTKGDIEQKNNALEQSGLYIIGGKKVVVK